MFNKLKWKLGKEQRKEVQEKEQILKELIVHNKLPLLVADKSWYDVKKLIENNKINEKEKIVLELAKERGSLSHTLKENEAVKQSLMKKVLEVSEALNKGNLSKEMELETLKQALTKLNEEIPNNEARIEEVEELLNKANKELVEEAVALSYTYMADYKKEGQRLEEEIDELREKLLEKVNMKKSYDAKIATLYHYLHNMVGYKHINKIDERLGESEK